MKTYSVKEAAKELNTYTRKIQRFCTRDRVRKLNNKYLITEDLLIFWKNELSEPATKIKSVATKIKKPATCRDMSQLDIEVESLKEKIKELDLMVLNLDFLNTKNKERIKQLEKQLQDQKENSKKELQINLKNAIEIVSNEAVKQGVTHKIFTNEEFEDIIGTIALSEHQEEQIQYLRNRISKQDEALISIAKQVEQRNYIEAMEKGFDNSKR